MATMRRNGHIVGGGGGGGATITPITKAEYDKLGDEKYTNGVMYLITDLNPLPIELDASKITFSADSNTITSTNLQDAVNEIVKTLSTHNHDNSYLNLSGGTMLGNIDFGGKYGISNLQDIHINNPSITGWLSQLLTSIQSTANAAYSSKVPAACVTISNWNSAVTNGWYMASGAANAPVANVWLMGHVIAHNSGYVIQEVWGFTDNPNPRGMRRYVRGCLNGTWGAWQQVSTPLFSLSVTTLSITV